MGGKKKKKKPWINKFTKQIQSKPPADISPFISTVQSKFEENIQSITQDVGAEIAKRTQALQTEQENRLQLLQNALLNAIGSLQYNPYAERTKQAFQTELQRQTEPLKQAEAEAVQSLKEGQSQAISQYSAITPGVSKALRMTGAYQWAQKNPTSRKAKDITKYYGEAYKSGMQFINQTRDFLKDLGFQDNEIEEAIKPYTSLIEEGYRML